MKTLVILFAVAAVLTLCAGATFAQEPPEKPEEPEAPETAPEEPEEPAEEKKPEPKSSIPCPGGEYVRGKGFAWQTQDGEYSLRIGGRFQFHWILDNYDIHRSIRLKNNSEFGLPRAYLFLNGHAFKEFKYALNYRIDSGVFDDWSVTWAPKELQDKLLGAKLDITAGHFKPRFSREFLTSSGGLSLVNRNLADARFRMGRDYGVNFTGRLLKKRLRLDVGFFNGLADSSTSNTNNRATGRIQLDLNAPPATQGDLNRSRKPALSLGLACSMENDVYDFDGNGVYDDNGSRWTADLAFYYQGLNIIGAYFGRTEQNQDTAGTGDPYETNRESVGYSLQGSYFLVPGKLELVAMMSYVVLDTREPRARLMPDVGWKHEARLGINYYLEGHALKIQADIGTIRERQTHGSLDDDQLRVQFTIAF